MIDKFKPFFGYIAIIGPTNSGKSTLVNRFMGTKVSIVTHKVQTTRTRVLGVLTQKPFQLVFIDTPGIFVPVRRLDRAMVSAAWRGVYDADKIVLLIDSKKGLHEDVTNIVFELQKIGKSPILVFNKIDLISRSYLLNLTKGFSEVSDFPSIFMVSALNGDGVTDLLEKLFEELPSGPWLYPEDQLTDLNERLFAAEITREKLFLHLHQELPYSLTVETEEWQNCGDGSVKIHQIVYVERAGQRGIVLGKGGKQIKRVGIEAREELEKILRCRVHLFVFVKVRESWADEPARYKEIGLDFVN